MNRAELSKQWYVDQFNEMQIQITRRLASPATYIDSRLTADPRSGIELYERYDKLRDQIRAEFPEWAGRLPVEKYRTDKIGTLIRSDRDRLARDITASLAIFAQESPTSRD